MMHNRLVLLSHDELFVVDLDQVLYFLADDHYAHVYYASGTHFLVPYGLSRIEAALAAHGDGAAHMRRMGRKYIVNTRRIFRVNTIKEQLSLSDDKGKSIALHIPKTVLRCWVDGMAEDHIHSSTDHQDI